MKMTSVDDMNIVKDLFIIPPEPSDASEPMPKSGGESVENAIDDSLRRDKNNLKQFMEVDVHHVIRCSASTRNSSSERRR